MNEHRLGALLLENPLMREEDLDRCLEIQQLTKGAKPLGQILVEEGLLTAEALEELLSMQATRRQAAAQPAPEVDGADLGIVLHAAVAASAGELILTEGRPAMARIGGQLQEFTKRAMDGRAVLRFAVGHMGAHTREALSRDHFVERAFAIPGAARGRMSVAHHFGGLSVHVRFHPEPPREPASAGLDDQVLQAVRDRKGLVLLAGGIRSGMTETLGALTAHIAEDRNRLVVVLDEQLEHSAVPDGALVVRRGIGEHAADYTSALRSAMRQDPDVIVVGDASTPEVFDLCLRAAESDRLVIAALPARSVIEALKRVLSFYPEREHPRTLSTLAAILRCVVALHLLPDADWRDQVMANEVLLVDEAVREVIRTGSLPQLGVLMRLEGAGCGHSLDASLLALLEQGRIRFEDAFSRAEDKNQILSTMQSRG